MGIIDVLNLVLVALIFIIFALVIVYFVVLQRNKNKSNEIMSSKEKTRGSEYSSTDGALPRESIYKFMEFDEIKDNMIIRKNRTQYVMVIQCQGVNYDLMSEQEKIAVEEGFVQFLNTLRFQIQLYVQTRSLNLKDIIDGYKARVKAIEVEVEQIRSKIADAQLKGNKALVEKLKYEERRKINVLEYGADVSEYIGRMSLNKNVLQQKTYVIVSYYTSEMGSIANYSKEEIDNMCFSELYTRCQSVARSLAASEVTGKILNSEELAELLYIAYNRDDSELLQLSKALDAEYDSLYNTAKDVLQKKQQEIEDKLDLEAVELATQSIINADEKREQENEEAQRTKKVKDKALQLIEEYSGQMDEDLYERAKEEVEMYGKEDKENDIEVQVEEKPEKKKPGRKKKVSIEGEETKTKKTTKAS